MANKKFWTGMLVMTLVFGMAVIGCDNGNSNVVAGGYTNLLNFYNGSTAPHNDDVQSASRLTQTAAAPQFNTVRDAPGGGFIGWAIEDGEFFMKWWGRSEEDFNRVVDAIEDLAGRTVIDRGVVCCDFIHFYFCIDVFYQYALT